MKKLLLLGLCACFLGGLTALAQSTRPVTPEEKSMSKLRQLAMCVHMYLNENRGYLPTELDQLQPITGITDRDKFEEFLINPRTGASPGYKLELGGQKISKIKEPAQTVMIEELSSDGKVDQEGLKAFVDGHVERHPAP